MRTAPRIQDYAIVGDGRTIALIARDGGLDWLALPRVDRGTLFAAILDVDRGGTWRIAPTLPFRVDRRYRDGTNVLETRFETIHGACRVIDFVPVEAPGIVAEHQVVRRVVGERGRIELEIAFEPRPELGRDDARLRDAGPLGLRVACGRGTAILRSDARLAIEGDRAAARVEVARGDTLDSALVYAQEGPAVLPVLGAPIDVALARTEAAWREIVARIHYDGPWRAEVERSLLALKSMVFPPSGAILAAPTTSLPERMGGDLNWDYRYCWLRDAAFTVRALDSCGFGAEASAFTDWLLHATRLTRPELNVLYDVFGERPPRERTIDNLRGHRGSSPVRVGNAAAAQLQLDLYGEVIDAVIRTTRGARIDRETRKLLVGFGEVVCEKWRLPDHGIWEIRGEPRHHTHSRLLCWVALDGLIRLHRGGRLPELPFARVVAERDAIRAEIETRGYNRQVGSYTRFLDGDEVDATALLVAWYGFEPATSPRVRSTLSVVRERLGAGGPLLYRYRGPDGAFACCSFWAAELLALGAGTLEEAEELFVDMLRYANDVGLYAEEIDPATGDALGNFPQGYTHVGLVNAALSIEERRAATRGRPHPAATRPEAHA